MKTSYVNTDLEIVTAGGLNLLAKALEGKGFVSVRVVHQKNWRATFELGQEFRTAENSIEAFLVGIESLEGEPLTIWSQCIEKVLNIVYQCGETPDAFDDELPSKTVGRIAKSGLALKVTINAPEPAHTE